MNTENSVSFQSNEFTVDCKVEDIKIEYDNDSYDEDSIIDCGMIVKEEYIDLNEESQFGADNVKE